MKRIILLCIPAVVLSVSSAESEIEVIEVFRAETVEELEAALVDGYPMNWLEEILNDESIPEEDRYWLDCRVRAVIAQDLHLFFDREGNPVHIEADWIAPGEDYWREHMIVNPVGEHSWSEINPETGLWGETGWVSNRFGEQTGSLALCEEWMQISRDGSVGLVLHKGSERVTEYGPVFFYFLYSDGTYFKFPMELWTYQYTLSQSGQYALLVVREGSDSGTVYLINNQGVIEWSQPTAARAVGNTKPVISPNDYYCAVQSYQPIDPHVLIQFFQIHSGEELYKFDSNSSFLSFSPSDSFLCISGRIASVINCYTGEESWSDAVVRSSIGFNGVIRPLECNIEGNIFCARTFPGERAVIKEAKLVLYDYSGVILSEYISSGMIQVSPHGKFSISHGQSHHYDIETTPIVVQRIGGEQQDE